MAFQRFLVVVSMALVASCGKGGDDTQDTNKTTDTTTTDTSGTVTETGTTVTETGETGATVVTPPAGLDLVSVDVDKYAELGYELATYEFGEDFETQYTTLAGDRPFFHVYRPIGGTTEALDLLLWFHGGHIGNDESEVPSNCSDETISYNINLILGGGSLVTRFVAERKWALVIPSSNWCDGGVGLGPDDLVDPENHWGWVHNKNILDLATGGHLGFNMGDDLYSWGTSAGATASVTAAYRYPGFTGMIVDSGGCDQVLMFDRDPFAMAHIFGGNPYKPDGSESQFYPNYQEASCTWQVENGLRVPMYIPYNQQDLAIPPEQPEALLENVDRVYPRAGVNYGSHDYDHLSPGGNYHVQTRSRNLPFGYSTGLMMQFLEGSLVYWREAEWGCVNSTDCTAGAASIGAQEWDNYSNTGGISVRPNSEAGVILTSRIDQNINDGDEVEVVVIVRAESMDTVDATAEYLRLSYTDNDSSTETVFTAGEFAPETQATDQELMDQYLGSRLQFVPLDVDSGTVTVEYLGEGGLKLDALVFVVSK
jgi:hypothetical protein